MLRPPLVTLTSVTNSGSHGLHSSAFFTFEKQAASLNDLDVVRKIVEREGCIEALSQLLSSNKTKASEPSTGEIDQTYPYTYPRRSILSTSSTNSRGSTASPMIVQSLLDQLRSVSVQIVEAIEQWRAANQLQVFQWRQLNYLLKMTSDLDFLANVPVQVDALQQLPRLTRNPFLAPMHLEHAALRERVPDQALALGVFVGNVDTKRVFFASKVLLRELETEKKKKQQQLQGDDEDSDEYDSGLSLNATMSIVDPSLTTALKHQPPQSSSAMRVRWSNQDVKTLGSTLGRDTSNSNTTLPPPSRESRKDEMNRDLELSRELIFHAEHELGAIREEVAILQTQLGESLARPERRRKLQNKIGALVNALKFKSGDLYQRKNELRRKEAVFKLACERTGGGVGKSGNSFRSSSGGHLVGDSESDSRLKLPESQQPHAYLSCVESVMQEDELRRQDIVERFATLARMRAATSSFSVSSTSRHKHKQQLLTPSGRNLSQSPNPLKPSALRSSQSEQLSLQEMSADDVALFLDALDLGYSYGDKFRGQGIDGALLAQATDQDLKEVGVALRLHRVRILEAIDSLRPPPQSPS
ncbi:hypothetical protein Gpo141_00004186 [Globisporangium polare]